MVSDVGTEWGGKSGRVGMGGGVAWWGSVLGMDCNGRDVVRCGDGCL